jgi:hypothetical protein
MASDGLRNRHASFLQLRYERLRLPHAHPEDWRRYAHRGDYVTLWPQDRCANATAINLVLLVVNGVTQLGRLSQVSKKVRLIGQRVWG